jgi:hypothetical protein
LKNGWDTIPGSSTWIETYSIAFGILFLVLAFRLRTWGRARAPRGAVAP